MNKIVDLTDIAWLRRRLGRGTLGIRCAAIVTAVWVGLFVAGVSVRATGAANPLVVGVLMLLVGWLGFGLASRLQRGNRMAAYVVLSALIPYTLIFIVTFGTYSGLVTVISGAAIYFILMAVVALLSRSGGAAREHARRFGIDPFRSGLRAGPPRPAFANKFRWGVLLFLALTVFVVIVPPMASVSESATASQRQTASAADPSLAFASVFGRDLGRKLSSLVYTPTGADISRDTGFILGNLLLPAVAIGFLYRRARRHATTKATGLKSRTANGPVILYLRSFRDDQLKMRARAADGRSWLETILRVSFEEIVVDHLWRHADVVAIGRPGEKLGPLGAARDLVPDDAWKAAVEEVAHRASLIVLVIGSTEGVMWELTRIVELGHLHKLLLLLPPVGEKELAARWAALTTEAARRPELSVPDGVDPRNVRALVFPQSGAVRALTAKSRDDWTWETVLDVAALRAFDSAAERTQAQPTLATA